MAEGVAQEVRGNDDEAGALGRRGDARCEDVRVARVDAGLKQRSSVLGGNVRGLDVDGLVAVEGSRMMTLRHRHARWALGWRRTVQQRMLRVQGMQLVHQVRPLLTAAAAAAVMGRASARRRAAQLVGSLVWMVRVVQRMRRRSTRRGAVRAAA